MAVGYVPVLNIDDRFVKILLREIVDDNLTGTPELGREPVRQLL